MDSFCPKYKTFELKNYRAVKCADTKFEEEPDCHCKNDIRNLVNFHLGT